MFLQQLIMLGILKSDVDLLLLDQLLSHILDTVQQRFNFDLLCLDLGVHHLRSLIRFPERIGHEEELALLSIDVRRQLLLVVDVADDFMRDRVGHLAHELLNLLLQVAVFLLNVLEHYND